MYCGLVRFEQRLGFTIEPRTAELIETARPMLRRITGERLRNELNLLLREESPERGLRLMQKRGILPAIHPAFHFGKNVAEAFQQARATREQWPATPENMPELYWHIIIAHIALEGALELCERLVFGRNRTQSYSAAARLIQQSNILDVP